MQDNNGNNILDFVKAYREAMEKSYQTNLSALNQQRQNDHASIMSNANRAGMMYSNFPMRDKTRYDADKYYPAYQKTYMGYRTGLDKLRENIIKTYNSNKSIQDAINHLNSMRYK